MKFLFKRLFNTFPLLSFIIFIYGSITILAADFKTDYQVEYNLSQSQNNLNSQVDFKIKIINLKSEVLSANLL